MKAFKKQVPSQAMPAKENFKRTYILFVMLLLAAPVLVSAQKSKHTPGERASHQTEWMKTNLKLTEDQVAKVSEINLKYAQKVEVVKDSVSGKDKKKEAIKALDKSKDAELKTVLNESQFQTYLAKKQEMIQKAKDKKKK